jgi:hypothetical protein
MEYGSRLLVSTENGTEIAVISQTLTNFRARRVSPGAAGTSTIELEINGVLTGDTLSWAFTDGAWSLKTTNINQAVSPGDRISFSITAVETGGPRDIFAEVD